MFEPDAPELTSAQRIGKMLKNAREQHQLSHDFIHAQLNISIRRILAIEAGDFETVGIETFVRGYISRYARLVSLDPDEVLADFSMGPPEKTDPVFEMIPEKTTFAEHVRKRSGILLGVIMAIGVVALLTTLFLVWTPIDIDLTENGSVVSPVSGKPKLSTEKEESSPVDGSRDVAGQGDSEQPVADNSGAVSDPPLTELGVKEPNGQEQQDISVSTANGESAAAARAQQGEQEQFTPPLTDLQATSDEVSGDTPDSSLDRIQLSFTGLCYTSVIDATGTTLYIGTANAGDRHELEGKAPFDIVLGHAAMATVTYQGEEVALGSRTRNRIARLSVGP